MKRLLFGRYRNVFIFVVLVGIYGFWLRARWIRNDQGYTCLSNLHAIAAGMLMYSEDYDGKLPPAIFHDKTVGWANGLQPYVKSYALFQCPLEAHGQQKVPQPDKPRFTDYWMNSNLAGLDAREIKNANKIIMLGDGDGGAPESTASYAIRKLPMEWRTLSDSPAKRHHGGAYYALADGHVKFLSAKQIAQVPPMKKSQFSTLLVK